jgi:hypothetical protein
MGMGGRRYGIPGKRNGDGRKKEWRREEEGIGMGESRYGYGSKKAGVYSIDIRGNVSTKI